MQESAAVAAFPPVEEPNDMTTRPARSTDDVMRLHIPLPYMLTVIGVALAIAAGIWRLDARIGLMEERENMRTKIEEANSRADNVLYDNMKQSIDDLKRQTQLLSLQYAELAKQTAQRK